MIEFSMNVF